MRVIALLLSCCLAGCGGMMGGPRDEASRDFENETGAADLRIKEDKVRSALGKIETSLADYVKVEKKIPLKLGSLVPKYLGEVPSLDLPVCGRESDKIQYYGPEILRGGQVDGSRLRGTGRWGYVYNDRQVIIFVDCLKTSTRGVPWYQERGVY